VVGTERLGVADQGGVLCVLSNKGVEAAVEVDVVRTGEALRRQRLPGVAQLEQEIPRRVIAVVDEQVDGRKVSSAGRRRLVDPRT
jgi:hypothetical protein